MNIDDIDYNIKIIFFLSIKMGYTDPSFEIDDKGRVICKKHSKYEYFIEPKDYFQHLYLEVELTCKTCSHYLNDNCFFPKSKIDEIELKRLKKREFFCKLCGKRIDRMLSIIHKLYNKEIYDIDMPLICCDCFEKINNEEFLSYSKKLTDFYILNIVVSIFFLFYFVYFFSILKIQFLFFLIIIIPIISFISFIVIFIIYICGKKLRLLFRGKKYYKKHFPQLP